MSFSRIWFCPSVPGFGAILTSTESVFLDIKHLNQRFLPYFPYAVRVCHFLGKLKKQVHLEA